MQTQTAKMIYPNQAIANMIAGKMTKQKGKHVVMKIATGFQVCPVTICQGAVSPNHAAPYPNQLKGFDAAKSGTDNTIVGDNFPESLQPVEDTLTFTFPYVRETKAWWYFDGGQVQYIHKSHPIKAEITGEAWIDGVHKPAMLHLTLTKKAAQKAGLA